MLHRLSRTLELADPAHSRMLPMEGLRGLAVTLVFLQHYVYQVMTQLHLDPISYAIAQAVRRYGNYGVELFFILSGFLIYGHLVGRRPPFTKFMMRRFERLYPTFIVVVALAVVLHVSFDTGKIPADPVHAFFYIGAQLIFLPGVFPIQPITSIFWSLSFEMFFYLLVGLAVSALHLDQRIKLFRIILICVCAVLLVVSSSMDFGIPMTGPAEPRIRALPFFAGMLLWEAEEAGWWSARAALALAAPVLAFLLTSVVALPAVPQEVFHTICLALLCSACFRGGNAAARAFVWTPIRWLGNMSYSYYLLHGFVTLAVLKVILHSPLVAMLSILFWSMLLPVYAASVVVSLGLFALVERPISLRPRVLVLVRAGV